VQPSRGVTRQLLVTCLQIVAWFFTLAQNSRNTSAPC
jgi:hypothetical protein